MKQNITLLLIMLSTCLTGFSQTAPDFTFTDINGIEHNLQNALDDGKVILLDFFFVNCGPCNTWAPEIDAIVADFEDTNLEVWAISDRDDNAYIQGSIFNPTHSNHFVGGSEGDGSATVNLFANNFNFTGFPTYAVICADGSITWDIWPISAGAEEIRNQLTEECGVMLTSNTYDIEALSQVSVYPNPAKNNCTVELNLEENTTLSLDLFNTLGQVVSSVGTETYSTGKQFIQLDLSNLSAGLYNLRMQSVDGIQSIDIVVK